MTQLLTTSSLSLIKPTLASPKTRNTYIFPKSYIETYHLGFFLQIIMSIAKALIFF